MPTIGTEDVGLALAVCHELACPVIDQPDARSGKLTRHLMRNVPSIPQLHPTVQRCGDQQAKRRLAHQIDRSHCGIRPDRVRPPPVVARPEIRQLLPARKLRVDLEDLIVGER